MKRWAAALQSDDAEFALRAFGGRGKPGKVSAALARFVKSRYRELCGKGGGDYRRTIGSEVEEYFGERLSGETLRKLFREADREDERGAANEATPCGDKAVSCGSVDAPRNQSPAAGGGIPPPPPVLAAAPRRPLGLHHAGTILFAVLLDIYRANLRLLPDGPGAGEIFYYDPHAKRYTGQLKLLKGWCGSQHGVGKVVYMDTIHTESGRACFAQHYCAYHDLRLYQFQWQCAPWERDPSVRRFVVRATNPRGNTIEVAILCSNPAMQSERAIWAMFNRWLQENDFKYLDVHYGINQLTSYASTTYGENVGQFEDRTVESAEHRKAASALRQAEARLARALLAVRKGRAKTVRISLVDALPTWQ